ncbi:2-amino-4-hydroxy-6-hydroxymethyldihydropteridine diphosphokinase [Corynebacterium flavescens]|uniref:2-amino-4-hydroxy-6- hydroxymethyldihydropteridine diphosphokinase n=1 Tax=Corynebacterium flavescens TaxID=28028 RepID=UPI003FD2CE91
MRAVLSIGSNLEDRVALLDSVFAEFADQIVASSPVYATPPWGVEDQEEFLNAVLVVEVPETPLQLLRRGQALEAAAQRVRLRHWGPRTLDVDIVQVEGVESNNPELTLPHPYAAQRAFVLVPWLSADPQAKLGERPVSALIAELDPAEVAAVRELGRMEDLR